MENSEKEDILCCLDISALYIMHGELGTSHL
jgi:hypothetical protein